MTVFSGRFHVKLEIQENAEKIIQEDCMNNLRKIRILKGLSQYELGAGVGLSQTRIWRIEQGYEIPSSKIKQELADLLQVEIADLFSNSEEELKARYEKLEKERDKVMTKEILKKWERVLEYRLNSR